MSAVTFDPARAADPAYKAEAIKLYNEGKLTFENPNDEKIFKGLLSTAKDENQYEIEDDSPKVERKKGTDENHGKIDLMLSTGAAASATVIGLSAAKNLSGWQAQMAGCNSMATEIACITAFAVGTKYEITRPNKDEHKELELLKQSMETGDVEIANALIKLQEAEGEVEVLRTEAEEIKETVDDELKAKEEELEKKQARIEELNTKAQSEEGLTEEEQAELEALTGEVQTLQDEITEKKADKAEDVEDKQGNIENKQDDVDEAEAVFNSVLDVANYAETFDEASKSSATLEAVAQGVNAAMGFGAAAALTFHSPILFLTPYGQVMRGLALAGAGMSTHGAIEQGVWAKDMGQEIDVRKDIQQKGNDAISEVDASVESVEDGVVATENIVEDLQGEGEEAPPADEPPVVPPTTNQPVEPDEDENGDGKEDDDIKEPPEV